MSAAASDGFQRYVIKIGSSLLIDDSGGINVAWLESLVDDLATLHREGRDVLIVSSGAIALGARALGINRRRAGLAELQAAAAAGQFSLVNAYQRLLERHDMQAAQILLTRGDTESRRRFLNARSTLAELLSRRVVPVINENDTVSTDEIRYGDNDRLAARVAQLVMADALILLSDVDGLYDADPRERPDATHIPEVTEIDSRIEAIAGETRTDTGSGGMATKVKAARIAMRAGCSTIITLGSRLNPVRNVLAGGKATLFRAGSSPSAERKQWLAGALDVAGVVTIDAGAAAALRKGGSLLPVGVTAAEGSFRRGDVISIRVDGGSEIARGLAEYAVDEAVRLLGVRSEDIAEHLGYRGRPVLVHRDELVVFGHD